MTDTLAFSTNQFGGVVTESDELPLDPSVFRRLLRPSLDRWAGDGYKVVWLEIPIERAALVPVAAEA